MISPIAREALRIVCENDGPATPQSRSFRVACHSLTRHGYLTSYRKRSILYFEPTEKGRKYVAESN